MLTLLRKLSRIPIAVRQFAVFKYKWDEEEYVKQPYEYSRQTHWTNAEELIAKVPPIEVDGDTARCTGHLEWNQGHPTVYIQLNTRQPHKVVPCPYCNLRYVKKKHGSDRPPTH